MHKLRPLGDKVVIQPDKEEEKTKGGVLLPETASKEKPQQGKVIAVGPGRTLDNGKVIPLTVKPEDRVIYAKYSGNEITVEEEELLIISEKDILAIIEE